MRPLTELSPPYYLRGGMLHPNGRWLFYGMNYDVAAGREIEATWVYRHDLETGERVPLACPQKPAYYEPSLNDAGTHILYERQDLDPAGVQTWLVDIEGREDREILNAGPRAKVMADWFPDGRRVLFLAETGTYRRVGMWDLETGESRWLLDDPSRNIEWAVAPRGSNRSLAILVEIEGARILSSLLDVKTGKKRRIPVDSGNLVPRRALTNGEWIGQYYSSKQPTDLVRFRLDNPRPDTFENLTRV